MAIEFKLPELGENITSGRVAGILVKEGDLVEKDQPLAELETDKAVIEVPSPVSGKVQKILIKEGEDVKIGQLMFTFEEAASEASTAPAEEEAKTEPLAEAIQQEKSAPVPEAPKPGHAVSKKEVIEIKVPELGENIEAAGVAKLLVKENQTIEKGQNLLELETDKAVLQVPAEYSGTVQKILVKEGDSVKVGDTILTLLAEVASEAVAEQPTPVVTAAEVAEETPAPGPVTAEPEPEITPQLPKREVKKGEIAPAAPSVRRFAREIGIDINQVPGSGPGGRISIEDVKAYSKMLNKQRALQTGVATGVQAEPLPDFEKWGAVERQPMNKVREKTALHLSYAWSTIPHVTQFDKADITELENLRKQYTAEVQKAGGKLTVTAILLKVVSMALKKFPQFNASIDLAKREIIFKKYVNIGVAVDTDRGLLVPVIKNVDQKGITELSVELSEISRKARDRKLSLEEMQGGNFSISNLGGIGGTGFTPVVNAPEVAILGVSRSEIQPVFKDGQFVPRLILPLSLSYDHRLIDGADAARFLRWVCQALEQPFLLSL